MLFKRSLLKKVEIAEVASIAGTSWATAWRKFNITPLRSGRVLIAQVSIGGKNAFPIIAQLGYNSRHSVIEALCEALYLSESECMDFLDCKRDMKSVLEIVEERLVSYNGYSDDDFDE